MSPALPVKMQNVSTIFKYVITGFAAGIIVGGLCVFFCWLTATADITRQANSWLIFLLPLTGLLVVFLYDNRYVKFARERDAMDGLEGNMDGPRLETRESMFLGMNMVFLSKKDGRPVSLWLAPLIFISTTLTYLTGGSIGRVGSALQFGCGISTQFNRLADNTVLIACGLSAGFTAMLGTPVAGAVFGFELLVLTSAEWVYIIPTLITAFTTNGIAQLLHVRYTNLEWGEDGAAAVSGLKGFMGDNIPHAFGSLDIMSLLKVCLIALLTTLLARLFIYGRRWSTAGFTYLFKNKFVRVIVGTCLVIVITVLLGTQDYNGIGLATAAKALNGEVVTTAFLWKLILTLLTLGCGIRGGEIAPVIFIGSTFGCMFAGLIGLDPCVGAAVGLVGTLSSATNCTLALFIFGLEAISFSPAGVIYFAITVIITHILSGRDCLYSMQEYDRIRFKAPIR